MTRLIAPLSADESLALIAAARSFLGASFRHQGRTPDGMDCIGLLVLSFAAIGKPLRNRSDYGKSPSNEKLDRELADHFGPPVAGDPLPGDVVALTWTRDAHHVGIVAEHPHGISLIHCALDFGRVVEQRLDAAGLRRIVGVYR